jgi:hypothetical protein
VWPDKRGLKDDGFGNRGGPSSRGKGVVVEAEWALCESPDTNLQQFIVPLEGEGVEGAVDISTFLFGAHHTKCGDSEEGHTTASEYVCRRSLNQTSPTRLSEISP